MKTIVSFFKSSIRRRLMAWGLALLGAALVLNTVAGSIYTRRQILQSNGELQMEVASLTAQVRQGVRKGSGEKGVRRDICYFQVQQLFPQPPSSVPYLP